MEKKLIAFVMAMACAAASGCAVGELDVFIITEKPAYKVVKDIVPVRIGGVFKGEKGLTCLVLMRDEERKTIFSGHTTFRGIDLFEVRMLDGKLAAADYWRSTGSTAEHFILKKGSIDIDFDADEMGGRLEGEFELEKQYPEGRPESRLILRCWFRLPKAEPPGRKELKKRIEDVLAGKVTPPVLEGEGEKPAPAGESG
ncbi:MAG: hypothetical protein E3J72_15940 [Planctomycetota bacterium]|nr:MAG: hypothetical protein E3J72_15940 [Planctomycetota bacterium]